MAEDPEGWEALDDRGTSESRETRGTGVSKWSLLLLGLAIAVAVVLGQNTDRVEVDVLWATFRTPLFLVVLLAGLSLTLVWEIGTLTFRHRRRRRR
ncbi:MAG TPA: hypothetical protein VIQ02_13255 [Jiangellaceae bacterium]